MQCLDCKYDLRQLNEHRCPECGRAFDPNDPSTFHYAGRSSPWLGRLSILIALSALLLPVLWYSTWLVAAVSLGHPPRPYVNDPKFINGWVSALHDLTRMVFICSPMLLMANIVLALMAGIQRKVSKRQCWWTILTPIGLTVVTWIVALLLMKAGGREVGIWFWD